MSKKLFRATPSSIGAVAVVLSLIGILMVSTPVLAQTGRGVIRGVVQDANQAVVPGANVTISHEGTGVEQKTQTNAEGIYYFGAVPIGPYALTVELAGFKKWTTKLQLQVGQTATVDAALELGNVETVIDVVGAAPPITTESAEVSDVKDFQRIQQLPLNGRQISQLFVLTPGVEGEAGGSNAPRVNGMKVGSVEISLDGVSVVDRFGGGLRPAQPGLDTIAEFRIETVGSDARYSRPATVTLATRSGTNQFHGSVFEYHRNNGAGLRTRNRLDTTGDANKLIRNEYGVTAGGPFMIPGYDGRNKSFWFFNYEGFKQRQEALTVSAVPTDAMWGGDLSNLVDDNGNVTRIYDPLTTDANGIRQPFPNNRIPANRLSSTLKVLQQLTAKPTNSINPFVGSNFEKAYPIKEDRGTWTFKGDHNLTDKDRLSVRWSSGTRNTRQEGGLFGSPVNADAGLGTGRSDFKYYNVSASYTRNFSPNFLNELLIGVNRNNNSSGTLADFKDWPKELGLPNPFGVTGWPTLYAYGAYPWGYWDSDNRGDQQLTAAIAENNATWIRGKHTFQFGGKFRPEQNNVRELQQAQGSHSWGTGAGEGWTSQWDPAEGQTVSFTGSGFADLALGLPSELTNQFNRGYFYFRQTERSLYFNDNWKVSPRLTLNFGLRWDNWTPYTEKFDRLAAVDIDTIGSKFEAITPGSVDIYGLRDIPRSVLDSWSARGLTYTTADKIGYPSKLFATDNNNFAPRLGAAFKITDKTVIRGGYGEYFWPMPLNQILQASRTNPPLNLRYRYSPQFADGSGDYIYRSLPTSQFFSPNATVKVEGIVELPGAQNTQPWDGRNWTDGRSQTWHLTLEREIMKDTAVRLTYTGNHGRDLEQRTSLNTQEAEYNYVARTGLLPPSNRNLLRVNPNWSLIGGGSYIGRSGFSNSNSAQIELERKYSNGLAFQWFYTFSRSLTTADQNGFDCCGGQGINSGGAGGTIPEVRQILGAPNLSFEQLRKLAYYNSTTVPAHRIGYNLIFDLPFGKGKKFLGGANSVLNQVVGGWQIATIGNWRGGFWRSLSASQWVFSDPILTSDQRVELTFNGRRQRLWFKGDFNPAGATNVTGGDLLTLVPADRSQRATRPQGPNFDNRLPQTLANGTVRSTPITDAYNYTPRGFIMGPGNWNTDLSLFKWFDISESIKLRFTADFFNAFNHPVDILPNFTTGLQDLSQQLNQPRIIQLSVRLNW